MNLNPEPRVRARPSGGTIDSDLPLVSVIMATYNCVDVVDLAIQSIYAQTYTSWELIVCDDGSTDGTAQYLADQAAQHPDRFTILRNSENRKLAYSLNRCLAAAQGDLIARMDADDISRPDRLCRQVEYLLQHPDVNLVGTAMRRFDESGEKDVVEVEERPDRWSLHRSVPFAHATIMMRRQTYIALNGYTVSPRTARGQDRDLWFRFYERGFVGANIAEPLYLVREDSQAIRRRTMKVRFNSFRTTLIGYRRLGYPLRWYIRPVLALLKGAIPFPVQSLYRRWQARGRRDPVRKFPNL